MDVYRKSTVALAATRKFRKLIVFDMANQRKLQVLIHPADEGTLDFISIYNMRDNIETYRTAVADVVRGILLYVLKEDDNVEKNLRNLNRVKWIMRGYNTVMALLLFAFLAGVYKLLQPEWPSLF